jgi:5-formyltetrahydrofolate cyclo-ligase
MLTWPASLESISLAIVARVQQYFSFPKGYVIGSYYPREDELNVRLLNFFLQDEGIVIAYPRVDELEGLTFHTVDFVKDLVKGPFGVMEAPESAPVVLPDLFLVPLLAFDARCHRLGYGKGHFDRTLQKARQTRNSLAIGVAYDMQRIDEMPNEPLDEQLDFVVTEAQIYKVEMI